MGSAYPTPGLYRKSFDIDMDPLVEVVQDTVGRHDSFGLACFPRYYEDLGYPGHINCTDNFNGELTPHGIAPRAGWNALNLFYNTTFDAANALIADEPWSRPGDYVLLRASNDLLCASSACPDDIDPANGWEITDIHVRVYRPENRFSLAIAHRVTPEADPVMTKETAFHPRTSALTRDLVEYRGYWLAGLLPGRGHDRRVLGLPRAGRDHGPLAAAQVGGARPRRRAADPAGDHPRRAQARRSGRLRTRLSATRPAGCSMTPPSTGSATTTSASSPATSTPASTSTTSPRPSRLRVWIKRSTDELHNVAVQGPESREIMREVVWSPPTQPQLEELRWFRFLIGRIGDYEGIPIVVSRTGYTGELGYEVWCHPDDGPAVWDAIWEAGQGRGLKPLGLSALDVLRIESGLIFAGYEFDDQVDPFEAGIGFAVALRVRGRLRRQGGTRGAKGPSRSAGSSGSSSPAARPPATATACTSAAPRSA